ncbi:MAG TPA: FecR domain-containing protein [Chloroflexota bacterium]
MEPNGDADKARLAPALERVTAPQSSAEARGEQVSQAAGGCSAASLGSTAAPPRPSPPRPRWLTGQRLAGRRALGIAALAVVVAAGLLWYVVMPRQPQAPPGLLVRAQEPTVVNLAGDVLVWRAGAREPTVAQDAVIVGPDDRVQTGTAGRASVAWPRGAVATLDPQSAIMLLPGAADDGVRVQLTEGSLWLDGGPDAAAQSAEVFTPDGTRVTGRRFQAQRDGTGRLLISTADSRATVTANEGRQELPPGTTSEVLVGRQPALPRPAIVPPAVAVAVDGPAGWAMVDRFGRTVGRAPEGGWIDQMPAVRGPLARERGTAAILPDPAGEYQLLLWGSEAVRPYRVALWPTDGQALFGGAMPDEAATALRLEGEIPAGGRVALRVSIQGQTIAAVGGPRPAAALPEWLRAAVPPGPRLAAAPSVTAAPGAPPTQVVIVGHPPPAPQPGPDAENPPPGPTQAIASAPPASDNGSSPAVAAALATVRAVATPAAAGATPEGAAPTDEAASDAESADGTATPSTPAFGYAIAGVPLAATATSLVPTAVAAQNTTPTPLVLQRQPTAAPTAAQRVTAPRLSGTVTVNRGMPPATSERTVYGGPPDPFSVGVGATPNSNRPASGAVSVAPGSIPGSVPPGTAPQGVPAGAPEAGVPPGYAVSVPAPPVSGVGAVPAAPSGVGSGPAAPASGVGAVPAAPASGVGTAAGVAGVPPLDASNSTTFQSVNSVPAGVLAPANVRPQGPTLLSGTSVPGPGVVPAAPAPSHNRGAASASRPR